MSFGTQNNVNIEVQVNNTTLNNLGSDYVHEVGQDTEGAVLSYGTAGPKTVINNSKGGTGTISMQNVSNGIDLFHQIQDSQNNGQTNLFTVTVTDGAGRKTSYLNCAVSMISKPRVGGQDMPIVECTFTFEDKSPQATVV